MAYTMGEKQKQAVRLLFEGERAGDIAAAVGVHRSTLWRWFRRPEMQRYAKGYFARRTRQLLGSHARRGLPDRLDSPDSWEALAAAERLLDMMEASTRPGAHPPRGCRSAHGLVPSRR